MDGPAKAGWSNTTGTHTLRLRQAVTQLPTVKPRRDRADPQLRRAT